MIAAKELPLQVRLSMNMTRLKDIENARLGGYGWFGGLVVLAELRRRVAALREVLKLPPCESFADLDEVSVPFFFSWKTHLLEYIIII